MRFVLLVAVAAASDFDRALELVTEAQNDCHKPVDLLRTSPRDGGFASGVHAVVAALSQSLLKGRVLTLEAKGHCHQARGRKSYAATPFHDVACAYATLFHGYDISTVSRTRGENKTPQATIRLRFP